MADILHDTSRLIALDRKLTRAALKGVGLALAASDLDLMVGLGVLETVGAAKSAALRVEAEKRQRGREAASAMPHSPQQTGAQPATDDEQRLVGEAHRRRLVDALAQPSRRKRHD